MSTKNRMKIEEDRLFNQFLDNRNLKPETIRGYTNRMRKYCDFIGKPPTELIQEARKEQVEISWMDERKIQKYFIEYYKYLRDEENFAPSNITTSLGTVKTFYNQYDIQLPRMRLKRNNQKQAPEHIPTHEDIKHAVENANYKYRAIITLMASSGMGSSEIRSLTVQDFLDALGIPINNPFDIYPLLKSWDGKKAAEWHICRVKTGMEYITFSTPESIRFIVKYLKRERDPPQSPDVLLFGFNDRVRWGESALIKMFQEINRRCHFPKGFFHSHAMRKYFASTLIRADIQQLKIDWMLGHKINPTTDAYFKAKPEDLKNAYLPIMEHLTFTEKVKFTKVTNERLQKLEEKQDYLVEALDIITDYADTSNPELIKRLNDLKRK